MSKNVLVIVAHSDDETFGCGGTISRHAEQGDQVRVLCMTNGVGSRDNTNTAAIKGRQKAAEEAAQILGFSWVGMGDFPDNSLDTIPILTIVKYIEMFKTQILPEVIYTHAAQDLNIDHRIVSSAVMTAFRPQPNEAWKEIRFMEVPSSTDWGFGPFEPNLTVDISLHWEKKKQALMCYSEEIRSSPHTRSISGLDALAVLRGHQFGFSRAEVFEVARKRISEKGSV